MEAEATQEREALKAKPSTYTLMDLVWEFRTAKDLGQEERTEELERELKSRLSNDAEAFADAITDRELKIEAIKNKKSQLNEKQRGLKDDVAALTDEMLGLMEALGVDKIPAGAYDISRRKGSHAVNIDDESQIPSRFKTSEVVTKIDKKSIREAIAANEHVPGASTTQSEFIVID